MQRINDLLTKQQFAEDPISSIILNLILCMLLVSILSWYYKKYSNSLGGKAHVGNILPLIGITVFLVITVVKSSLALSLGLVGALSIVRFRTPIKEPEELGFLFLTIAVGLGFGAGYQLITTIVTLIILLFLYLTKSSPGTQKFVGQYTLVLSCSTNNLSFATNVIEKFVIGIKTIRVDTIDNTINTYFSITVDDNFDIHKLISALLEQDKENEVKLIESGVNW